LLDEGPNADLQGKKEEGNCEGKGGDGMQERERRGPKGGGGNLLKLRRKRNAQVLMQRPRRPRNIRFGKAGGLCYVVGRGEGLADCLDCG